jgi:hypothetical protein
LFFKLARDLLCAFLVAGGCLVVSVLAMGHKVREFKPGKERLNFKGDKNP